MDVYKITGWKTAVASYVDVTDAQGNTHKAITSKSVDDDLSSLENEKFIMEGNGNE